MADRPTKYPDSTWIPTDYYSVGSNYPANTIPRLAIVNHIMDGYIGYLDDMAKNGSPDGRKVSPHFAISAEGEVHQYVELDNVAWHAGVVNEPTWPLLIQGVNPNYYTIGIEHEDKAQGNSWNWPAVQVDATVKLQAWLFENDWIRDAPSPETVVGHHEINAGHDDPGKNWYDHVQPQIISAAS